MRINYITSESLARSSGGWSGLSCSLYHDLARQPSLTLNYVGPVHPPVRRTAKLASKLRRVLGGQGSFYPFSEDRLAEVGARVDAQRRDADYDLFIGVTRWIRCRSARPYGAYLDACFRTYFNNNLPVDEFCPADIARIEAAERQWLAGATHVFWASAWARDEAVRHYGLGSENHHVVGIGGNLAIPDADTWAGDLSFLFIAQNFALKGGVTACAAFRAVQQRHPQARLVILGQQPPDGLLRQPGVEYAGYLRKDRPAELARLRALLGSAFGLVYPTTSDTIGQVIIECGYCGCPAIAPRAFAIPEIVVGKQTGLLIDAPFEARDFAAAMLWLIDNRAAYVAMRHAARAHAVTDFSFAGVTRRLAESMRSALPRPRAGSSSLATPQPHGVS